MIDEEKFNKAFDRYVAAFGEENEMRMCIEEMSELTKELCKFIRFSHNDWSEENDQKLEQIKKNIIEETADVLITASQIKRIFGSEAVEEMMNYKVERGGKIVDEYLSKKKIGDKNERTSN